MRHRQNFILAAACASIIVTGLIGLPKSALAAELTLQVAGQQHVLKKGDIRSAAAILQETGYAVSVSLDQGAAKLLCTLTAQNISKRMKILLNGKPVIDAVIRAAICGGLIVITGAFSKKEAEKIASDLKQAT